MPYHPTWPLHRNSNSLILEILKFLNYSYFAKIMNRKPNIGKLTKVTELYPFLESTKAWRHMKTKNSWFQGEARMWWSCRPRGIQGHALWERFKFTLSQMPRDMFYCISSGNCFSSFLYSYCNICYNICRPRPIGPRLATPLGSMKYPGNFLSSHRNQESAI